MSYPVLDHQRPIIIGHRGSAGTHPENTIASFARAVGAGVDMLESDLHLANEGNVIMIHDPRVDRTTDGQGGVSQMSLIDIKKLDAGYRFTPDGGRTFPFRGKGLEVPGLSEAFDVFPQMPFHLDLKSEDPELVRRTLDIIEFFNKEKSVILTSFNESTLRGLRKEISERGLNIPVAASSRDIKNFLFWQKLRLKPPGGMDYQVLAAPDRVHGLPIVTQAFNRHARRQGLKVYVWTVNEERDIRRVLAAGADGIFTDFPARAVSMLPAYQSLTFS